MMSLARATELLSNACAIPDDGRWHARETVVDGMLISGMMRKVGVQPIQFTQMKAEAYKPRIFERTVSDGCNVMDYRS